MLEKIISIKNIGRFLDYQASGDVEFKRYNLIFAENGRGKSTLCAILRSLQTGEPSLISGRSSLGADESPTIVLRLDTGTITFSEDTWSATFPDLAIFDSTFVSKNVFSGEVVDLEHRRNLHSVIVGKQGADLVRQIEGLDRATRAKSEEIRVRQSALQPFLLPGMHIKTFVSLKQELSIDAMISDKLGELQAVKDSERIKGRPALSEISLLALPTELMVLLAKELEDLAKDAEKLIHEQVKSHNMHDQGEEWLSQGLNYIPNNTCPFCGQDLDSATTLISAYKAYFSEAYKSLQTEIADLRAEVQTRLSERKIAEVERLLEQNRSGIEFWARYCKVVKPELAKDEELLGDTLRALRQAATALLDRKAAAPLEPQSCGSAFEEAEAAMGQLQTTVDIYNQAVREANTTIEEKKAATAAADPTSLENTLAFLRATKKRHEPSVAAVVAAYASALKEKKQLEIQKEDLKEKLDAYSEGVVIRYEEKINRLLDDFNAGFRIIDSKHGYPGGVASSSYRILINDVAVDLGDSATPLNIPSFRNTLSSGDKSTLALAFFLAQLEQDEKKDAKVVVFDDPFNSQDRFRKECTVQRIKECGESCRQVIVLSHDEGFLARIWERLNVQSGERKGLHLARVGVRDTRITEWHAEVAIQPEYQKERKAMVEYYNSGEGNPIDIVRKIRPVLETHFRALYPHEFGTDCLGEIIGKVRVAGATQQLFCLLESLEVINDYTRPYHHGDRPQVSTESIDTTELQGFVKTTIDIVGGC